MCSGISMLLHLYVIYYLPNKTRKVAFHKINFLWYVSIINLSTVLLSWASYIIQQYDKHKIQQLSTKQYFVQNTFKGLYVWSSHIPKHIELSQLLCYFTLYSIFRYKARTKLLPFFRKDEDQIKDNVTYSYQLNVIFRK